MRTNNIPEQNRLGLVTLPKSESDQYTEGEQRKEREGGGGKEAVYGLFTKRAYHTVCILGESLQCEQ